MSELSGIPLLKHPHLPDGQIVLTHFHAVPVAGPAFLIGTCPLTPLQQAGKDARLTVRRGLADVLAWLGEQVENEPTGEEIYARLMQEATR